MIASDQLHPPARNALSEASPGEGSLRTMQHLADHLIASGFFGAHPPRDLVYALIIFVLSLVVFIGVAFPFAAIVTWVERRVWARIQSRVGPEPGRSQRLPAMAGRRRQARLQGRHHPATRPTRACSRWRRTW